MRPEHIEDLAAAFRKSRPPLTTRPARTNPLPCPVCSTPMVTEAYQGVQLDVCPAHGSWLDVDEVSQLIQRIQSGERLSTTRAVRDAKRQGKVSGMFFGVFSLLFDGE